MAPTDATAADEEAPGAEATEGAAGVRAPEAAPRNEGDPTTRLSTKSNCADAVAAAAATAKVQPAVAPRKREDVVATIAAKK
mmetsp:Transcript_62102/g.201343  ORF Transcript_62102/g.201343 Transcript_62102/m.201343 type:complete len:82 (-) Transcript_62102:55-300(-)